MPKLSALSASGRCCLLPDVAAIGIHSDQHPCISPDLAAIGPNRDWQEKKDHVGSGVPPTSIEEKETHASPYIAPHAHPLVLACRTVCIPFGGVMGHQSKVTAPRKSLNLMKPLTHVEHIRSTHARPASLGRALRPWFQAAPKGRLIGPQCPLPNIMCACGLCKTASATCAAAVLSRLPWLLAACAGQMLNWFWSFWRRCTLMHSTMLWLSCAATQDFLQPVLDQTAAIWNWSKGALYNTLQWTTW